MATQVVKNNNNVYYGIVELICDTQIDLEKLSTNYVPGSRAFVIESSSTYMLNTERRWIPILTGSSEADLNTIITELNKLEAKVDLLEQNVLYRPDSK